MEKELPLYKIVINDDETTGVDWIAIVDDPAIESNFIMLNKNYSYRFDTDKKILMGPLLIPDKKIYRYSPTMGEYNILFDKETIEKIVKKYNKNNNNNKINIQHNSEYVINAFLTENWIIEDETYDKSKKYNFELPLGTWMASVYIEDDKFWKDVIKSGEFKGFSVELIAEIEQMLSKVDYSCELEGCGCKGGKGGTKRCNHYHDDLDWEYVEEVMIRAELLKHQYEEELKAGKLKFRRIRWERWVASDDCKTCPICRQLHLISWVIQGSFFTYRWGSNSKQIEMPRYRKAHQSVGEGRWNAPDKSCRCKKETFVTDSDRPNLPPSIPLPPCD